jgi:hypothetical protein
VARLSLGNFEGGYRFGSRTPSARNTIPSATSAASILASVPLKGLLASRSIALSAFGLTTASRAEVMLLHFQQRPSGDDLRTGNHGADDRGLCNRRQRATACRTTCNKLRIKQLKSLIKTLVRRFEKAYSPAEPGGRPGESEE